MLLTKWLWRSSSYKYLINLFVFVSMTDSALSSAISDEHEWYLEAAPRAAWVLSGSRISVNCLNFTGKYAVFASNIGWFKLAIGGKMISRLPTSLDARIRSNGHQLQILNAEAYDEGLYCCMPIQNASIINCKLAITNLSIALPPVIAAPVRHQTAKVGDHVILQCIVSFDGKPAAVEYSWQKFGKSLDLRQPKYYSVNLTDLFILMIYNVTETDEGLYDCLLMNAKYQKANESIYLQLLTDSPERCDKNISVTFFVGLYMASKQSCNYIKSASIGDILTAYVSSLCNNCTKLCANVDNFKCLNMSVAIVKISLQGTKALEIYNTLKASLQRMDLHIEKSNYYLTCLDPWCDMRNEITPEKLLKSSCNFEIFIFSLLMILFLVIVLMIIKYYRKRKQLNMKQQTYCLSDALPPTKGTQVHFYALKQPVKN